MFSRAKIKRYRHQRAAFIVSKLLLFLISLAMIVILLWLRIDWGTSITNWVYWSNHIFFKNFSTGLYISFAGHLKGQYFTFLQTDSQGSLSASSTVCWPAASC